MVAKHNVVMFGPARPNKQCNDRRICFHSGMDGTYESLGRRPVRIGAKRNGPSTTTTLQKVVLPRRRHVQILNSITAQHVHKAKLH